MTIWNDFAAAGLFLFALLPFPPYLFAQEKTLTRQDDPVVMAGRQFQPRPAGPAGQLALVAWRDHAWAPVPFQIDQKKPDGSYCFTQGPEAGADPDPDFDANDELVFMAKDSGDRAEPGEWPAGARTVREIELTDPQSGEQGWLYLAGFAGQTPRSGEDYIRVEVDPAAHYRRVITYEYIMGGPMDRVYPDFMAANRAEGSRGKDVLDRLKMRGEVVLPMGITVPFAFDEMTKAQDVGWIDGPVRVLHLAQGYIEIAKYFRFKIEGYSLISYYVNHMIWPIALSAPGSSHIIKTVNFRGYMDFCPAVYGSYPFSAANPLSEQVILDGHMSEAEKHLDTRTPIAWNAGFGPQGALVSRLFTVPPIPGQKQLPYYLDDATVNDPPEACPGVSAVGYTLVNPSGEQPPGVITYQYYYFLNQLQPEQVQRILDILDHPLQVKTQTLAPLAEDLTQKNPQ